jgi:hypothetical protein
MNSWRMSISRSFSLLFQLAWLRFFSLLKVCFPTFFSTEQEEKVHREWVKAEKFYEFQVCLFPKKIREKSIIEVLLSASVMMIYSTNG